MLCEPIVRAPYLLSLGASLPHPLLSVSSTTTFHCNSFPFSYLGKHPTNCLTIRETCAVYTQAIPTIHSIPIDSILGEYVNGPILFADAMKDWRQVGSQKAISLANTESHD